jgi:Zn-dependent M16 (insulinase) family peptidase
MELQQYCMMAGHRLAFGSVQAHFRASNAATEANSGITFVNWVHDLSRNFDSRWEAYAEAMEAQLAKTVCRKRMILSITEEGCTDPSSFITRFPEGTEAPAEVAYTTALPKKLGIRIPAQVSYASIGYHVDEIGMAYDDTAPLVGNILSLAYLWNEVRVQGGAYGAGMRIGRSGGIMTYSYRDPSPARSLGVYRSMGSFLKSFAESGEDITGFIISTISETEPLAAPATQGKLADMNWFSGFTYADALKERQALLSATTESLAKWCPVLDALKDGPVCVVGYNEALETCAEEGLTLMDI